jgi:hypothetical protein
MHLGPPRANGIEPSVEQLVQRLLVKVLGH